MLLLETYLLMLRAQHTKSRSAPSSLSNFSHRYEFEHVGSGTPKGDDTADVHGAYCVNRETSRLRVIWQPSDGQIMRNSR